MYLRGCLHHTSPHMPKRLLYQAGDEADCIAITSEDLEETKTAKKHPPSIDEILGKADVGWGPCDGNLAL